MTKTSHRDQMKCELLYRNGIANASLILMGAILILSTKDIPWYSPIPLLWLGTITGLLIARIRLGFIGLEEVKSDNPGRLVPKLVAIIIAVVALFCLGALFPAKYSSGASVVFVLVFVAGALTTSISYYPIKSVVWVANVLPYSTLLIYYLARREQDPAALQTIHWPIILLIPILFCFGITIAARLRRLWNRSLDVIEELEQSHHEVKSKTIELEKLAREKEQEAEKAAIASKAKSTFLANISHEIRTPLNSVIGFSQLLNLDDTLSEDQQANIKRINQSGNHLLLLINDVLDMSKIEENQLELEESHIDLIALLEQCFDMTRLKAEEKNLEPHLKICSNTPRWVKADSLKLRQVIMNLLSNATKYTDQGSYTLSARKQKNGRIRIGVKDTGRGIEESLMARLFRPFEQCQVSDSIEGTGLGLSISRGLIELMGGKIKVESSSAGSDFFFTVSLEEIEPETIVAKSPKPPQSVKKPKQKKANATVMIVDDIHSNRVLLENLLRTVKSIDVISVENGEKAVELSSQQEVDIVLMDKRMPGIDGYEAARKIKAQAQSNSQRHPTVIMISADALSDSEEKQMESIDGFIAKPFDVREVRNTVEQRLSEIALSR